MSLLAIFIQAFAIAYDRPPKRLGNDTTEVDEIYTFLGMKQERPPAILRKVIENMMDINSEDE